jgi:hypothetical protein
MAKTHWKKLTNPDYLGAYAVDPDEDLIATIDYARQETFTGTGGKKDEGLVIHFEERELKPMICNATNSKNISKVAKSPYIEDWSGLKIAIHIEEVSAFGETVDALRVRPTAPRVTTAKCEDCGEEIHRHGDYSVNKIVTMTRAKYGKALCWDCALKAKEASADE